MVYQKLLKVALNMNVNFVTILRVKNILGTNTLSRKSIKQGQWYITSPKSCSGKYKRKNNL